jgi:pyridoxal phosphate enzyme (YggS family)
MEFGNVKENFENIKSEIEKAAKKTERSKDDITIVAVTKNVSLEKINEAISLGIKDIGENRVQEAMKKLPNLHGVRKHFIGHLQSNKVRKVVNLFDMVQSVDSFKIGKKISDVCLEYRKVMPILVQVLTDEKKDFGVPPYELENLIEELAKLKGIRVYGLMTIAPQLEDAKALRNVFRNMKKLFEGIKRKNIDNVEMRYLSMGMSSDFTIAIEEGANMIRIGRALFEQIKN